MTISLKHNFTSSRPDGTDSTMVQPSNWNAEHTLTQACLLYTSDAADDIL
jgi:hypothetical protein